MADKAITELVEASQVTATDLFVLQQDNTAKKLSGQTLINYLLKMIDGHGGVRSWEKVASVGLVDTYRFTMSDETAFEYTVSNGRAIDSITPTTADGLTRTYTIAFNDGSSESFTVTDGRGILSFKKTATEGLVDTYTIVYNNGDSDTFTVKNGEKGDKGDNAYVHFKYASEEPTSSSSSIGDIPDNWMGIYSGNLEEAPEDYSLYTWFKVKGEKGDTGDPATLVSALTTYQVGDSGNVIPSGIWSTTIPVVPQGKYLWTRQVIQFNTGDPVTTYSVARFGIDGAGTVSSVAGVSPDETGNVPLTASNVKALPLAGGDMEGPVNMNGQTLSGLNAPTEEDEAATKGYVDENGGDLVVDLEDAGAGEPNGINADTLGGQLPEYDATADSVNIVTDGTVSYTHSGVNNGGTYISRVGKMCMFTTQISIKSASDFTDYANNLIGCVPDRFRPHQPVRVSPTSRDNVFVIFIIDTSGNIYIQPFATFSDMFFALTVCYICE